MTSEAKRLDSLLFSDGQHLRNTLTVYRKMGRDRGIQRAIRSGEIDPLFAEEAASHATALARRLHALHRRLERAWDWPDGAPRAHEEEG